MKMLFTFLLLSTTLVGQQVSHQPGFVENPQHASQGAMMTEHNLLGDDSITVAAGEQTLYDAASATHAPDVALGTAARQNKAEHAAAPKAKVLWTNQ